jgi:hypothetical protein
MTDFNQFLSRASTSMLAFCLNNERGWDRVHLEEESCARLLASKGLTQRHSHRDIKTHHVREEYKGSSFFWLSNLTWGNSNPTQYFLLGCRFLDADTSL